MAAKSSGYGATVEAQPALESGGLEAIQGQLEHLMQQARPGLLRQAIHFGIAPVQAEDVVQETLLQGWSYLAQLRSPDHFQAWMHGICRHICLNWQRTKHAQLENSHLLLSHLLTSEDGSEVDMPDPASAFDPVEDLQRQDLQILLDRALSYLPVHTRKGIELHYLEELPQKEVAARLGTSEQSLKIQLHRARQQLWQIFNTDLRADALAFGLVLEQEESIRLKQTPIWCYFCGQHRLQGRLETIVGQGTQLELYCPLCSYTLRDDAFLLSGGLIAKEGLSSFWPAFKQLMQRHRPDWPTALSRGYKRCLSCSKLGRLRVEQLEAPFLNSRTWITLDCPSCGDGLGLVSCLDAIPGAPYVSFLKRHPRAQVMMEEQVTYQGESALRIGLMDQEQRDRLLYFLHPHTLEILGSVTEG